MSLGAFPIGLATIVLRGGFLFVTHISARLAWHMNGWDGHICSDPVQNSYCVGQHSYPGELILENRDLDFEKQNAGCPISKCCNKIPCSYSANAFGLEPIPASAAPPSFFNDSTATKEWLLEPATVCVWPYEVMYSDDVKKGGNSYDYKKRLQNAKDYFGQITPSKSLIFYYANYSNPLNENEEKKY